jgi:hypothetical protein
LAVISALRTKLDLLQLRQVAQTRGIHNVVSLSCDPVYEKMLCGWPAAAHEQLTPALKSGSLNQTPMAAASATGAEKSRRTLDRNFHKVQQRRVEHHGGEV